MTRAIRNLRFLSLLAALALPSALPASDAGVTNHFILPCRDECTNPRWEVTGGLATAREHHTATLLPNGKVLVVGGTRDGWQPLDSAETYDPASGRWSTTGRMNLARVDHTATLLADGRVLITGGNTPGGPPSFGRTDTAELYDPATGNWRPTGSMSTTRSGHGAVRLQDGRVLVAGGFDLVVVGNGTFVDPILASAEIYDPETGTWSATGSLNDGRYLHTMTVLEDGKVLVARGSSLRELWYNALMESEVYDPADGAWRVVGDPYVTSTSHTATLLPGGQILFAGGRSGSDVTSELYDPATHAQNRTGDMLAPRHDHAAVLLPDGSVLIAGGADIAWPAPGRSYDRSLASAERFDPQTATWGSAPGLNIARHAHTMTLLPDGTVLAAGGRVGGPDFTDTTIASAERYIAAVRPAQGAVPLRDGRTSRP